MTLPFFSAGGSSLFTTLMMCGLLENLSRRARDV
ncbi:MAG TPA: FtsW/RodA/SpoVE family cell cycle protein [Spirochaetia bacterium]|nr:FtsW/RodA/SpoVE family cell cycle protein [Spirochaetia bacterium]